MPAQPENVDTLGSTSVVVSTRGHAVTILRGLRGRRDAPQLRRPRVPALAPDLVHAYVTDDARGQLDVIDLRSRRVVRRLDVGRGAHHMAVDPAGNAVWVALGERARRITRWTTSDAGAPTRDGPRRPQGLAHDLAFSPTGRTVWVTYDDRASVGVFDAATGRLRHTIATGPPPQHWLSGRAAASTSQRQRRHPAHPLGRDRPHAPPRPHAVRVVQPRPRGRPRHGRVALPRHAHRARRQRSPTAPAAPRSRGSRRRDHRAPVESGPCSSPATRSPTRASGSPPRRTGRSHELAVEGPLLLLFYLFDWSST